MIRLTNADDDETESDDSLATESDLSVPSSPPPIDYDDDEALLAAEESPFAPSQSPCLTAWAAVRHPSLLLHEFSSWSLLADEDDGRGLRVRTRADGPSVQEWRRSLELAAEQTRTGPVELASAIVLRGMPVSRSLLFMQRGVMHLRSSFREWQALCTKPVRLRP